MESDADLPDGPIAQPEQDERLALLIDHVTEEIAFLDDVLVDRHSANDAFATFLRPVDRPCHEEIGDRVATSGSSPMKSALTRLV